MKLIRSVIALMLISLSSPYFLHSAARAAAGLDRDDDPSTTLEEVPREHSAEAPARPFVPGGIAAAVRAMNMPEPTIRAPEHGWLSFVVQGEGIPPIPYTTDSQVLLRMALERSNLGPVPGHPHTYYVTQEWADNVAKGTPVRPLTIYFAMEEEGETVMYYCNNQILAELLVKKEPCHLAVGSIQVFCLEPIWTEFFKDIEEAFRLNYFYVVAQGDDPLNIWCCKNQIMVRKAIKDSALGPVPGAAPNVFYVTPAWKKSLDEAGTQLLNLRVVFPGNNWLKKAWLCSDQRLVRQAIRESRLGRVPDGVTNTYYVNPEWKERLEKADGKEESFSISCSWISGGDVHLLTGKKFDARLIAEAIIDSGTLLDNSHKYWDGTAATGVYHIIDKSWTECLVKSGIGYNWEAETRTKDRGSCCVQ